jgi:hypothetical protein
VLSPFVTGDYTRCPNPDRSPLPDLVRDDDLSFRLTISSHMDESVTSSSLDLERFDQSAIRPIGVQLTDCDSCVRFRDTVVTYRIV